jgi:predicted phage terminase large subunit-like protein
VTGSKVVRAVPFSAQWQGGNVLLLEGAWNRDYLQELEGFPDALHDDMVDASADAFKAVANTKDWSALIS